MSTVVSEKEDVENLRIRVTGDLIKKFNSMVLRKRVSKQDAIAGILEWFVNQDDTFQSMILGQIEPSEDLLELLVRRVSPKFTAALDHMQDPAAARNRRLQEKMDRAKRNQGNQ